MAARSHGASFEVKGALQPVGSPQRYDLVLLVARSDPAPRADITLRAEAPPSMTTLTSSRRLPKLQPSDEPAAAMINTRRDIPVLATQTRNR